MGYDVAQGDINDGGGPKYYPEGFTVSNLNITGNTSTGVQSGALLIILQ